MPLTCTLVNPGLAGRLSACRKPSESAARYRLFSAHRFSRLLKPCPGRGFVQHRRQASSGGPNGNGDGNTSSSSSKEDARTEELVKALERQGVDLPTAKKVLQAWREVGIESSDDLQKALKDRTGSTMTISFLQALLDGTAAYVAYSAAHFFDEVGGLSIILSFVSYGIFFLYSFNAFFDIVTILTILGSEDTYAADSAALMRAVKRVAGEDRAQLDVLGKAQRAINMVKIVRSLNEVSMLMKESEGGKMESSLERLAAYLTLANAEKNGFDPAKYGMGEAEALRVAAKFARFDANDDGALELSEIELLFREMGLNFNEEESKAALDVLDIKRNGVVDFEEFVEWYTKQIPEPPASSPSEPSSEAE